MTKPDSYSITLQPHNTVPEIDAIKPYSQIVNTIMRSVWKLLLINLLILLIVSCTLIFTDAGNYDTNHKPLRFLLNGLILYFINFPCIKALIHLTSLRICRMQLDSSRMQLAELMPESCYTVYIKQPLRSIRFLFRVYPPVIILHLLMAFGCYYLKYYFL